MKYLEGKPSRCESENLSEHGALLRTEREPRGARKQFIVEISAGEHETPIFVWARRVWKRGSRQAVEFLRMDAPDRARLARLAAS